MHGKILVVPFLLTALMAHAACQAAEGPSPPAGIAPMASKPGASNETETMDADGVVTLHDALVLALARNPGLSVFPYELRAADARRFQAGLRPNPELEVEVEEFGGRDERSGFDAAETTIQIGQPIELAGKRAKRARVASLDRELVQWDYESARLDVIREVTRSFAAVLAAQERLALAEKLLELSQRAREAVAQRVQAGKDSPVDELRAGVALSETEIGRQKAEKALTAARHNLAAAWGDRTPVFSKAAGEFYETPRPMEPEEMCAAISDNPDLARWKTEEQRRRAALRLEKANAVPDVTIGGGVRRFEETDDAALVFGLAVPIPFFDRNEGGIRAATADLAKTRRQYEAAQVKTLAALSEAAGALAAAYDEVAILKNDVLPRAQEAFEAAQQGYRQGKFDYLYVLDAQRTYFEVRARYVDSVEAYHQAQADVERLMGRSPGIINETRQSSATPEPSSREVPYEK